MKHGVLPLLLVVLVSGTPACNRRAQSETPPRPPEFIPESARVNLFSNLTVPRIEIEIPRAGMAALRRTHWGGGEQRPTVKATVKEAGVVYTDVALHLKGAAGSFRSVDDRPAMTLNFDKFVPGQSFHGLRKISLNNSEQDGSRLSEKVCRELFEEAGVPVPQAGHALVTLNGRDLGFYVVLEGANKQFLERHFRDASGNLYDGGFVRDIDEDLSINSGDNPEDDSGLQALRRALRESRQTGTLAPLEQVLDVDRFLSMVSMEVLLFHWDGYAMNKNNWRLFHDKSRDKMVFIPHGIDQTFGQGRDERSGPNVLSPPISGAVAVAVMRTPEGRKRYRQRVGQLYTNILRVDRISARIDEIQAAIRPALAEWKSSAARAQQHEADDFKARIARRAEMIGRQFGTPVTPLKFGSDGIVRLTGWKPSTVRSGDPVLSQGKERGGVAWLGIAAGSELSSGSWRVRVILAEGQYRFQGRIRVKDVTLDDDTNGRGGAGLRISKGVMPRKLTGTADWTQFQYDFNVEDEAMDVELVCELRALKGEAHFDAGSLQLVRLP